MSFEWQDIVGGIGVLTLLVTYLFLQLNRLSAESLRYSVLNGVGSGLILVSLTQSFNFSAFVIEAAWLLISIVGIVITLRTRRSKVSQKPNNQTATAP